MGGLLGGKDTVLTGARILVVDDEVLHLHSLDRALQNEGCEVKLASSVADALKVIANDEVGFHAAVVDYMLLDRRGSEVVKALCSGERFTASIVLTGAPSREVLSDSYQSGVLTMLTKPVPLDVLLPEVEACVDKTIKVRHQYSEAGQPRNTSTDSAVIGSSGPRAVNGSRGAAVALARREDRAAALGRRGSLSDREREVLLEVFTGRKNAHIAERLKIAERTVKFHISNINKKLSVNNRGELMALLAGDLEPDDDLGKNGPANGHSGTSLPPVDSPN